MLKPCAAGITVVLITTWTVATIQAGRWTSLVDEFDYFLIVGAVRDHEAVKKFRQELDTLQEKLRRKNRHEIEQLLGKPKTMQLRTYAMPVAQARSVVLPGFGPAPSKTRFYPIKDVGGLEIWYAFDGESPQLVVVRLKVDKTFPKLTEKNLNERLAWDRQKFDKLAKFVEQREKEVNKDKKK